MAEETTTTNNNANYLGRYSLRRVGYGGSQDGELEKGTVTGADDTLSGIVFFEFHQDLLDDTGSIGLNYGLYGMVGKDNETPCDEGVEIRCLACRGGEFVFILDDHRGTYSLRSC